MSTPNPIGSGDGTRPTTDGGVDNIGGAGKLPGAGDASGPVAERAADKRRDAAAASKDDSAPLGLTQDSTSEPNTETPPKPDGSD